MLHNVVQSAFSSAVFGIDSFSNVDTSHICSETHLQSNVEQQVFQQTTLYMGNTLQPYKIQINIHAIKTN